MSAVRYAALVAASFTLAAGIAACSSGTDSGAASAPTSSQRWTCPPTPTSSEWTVSARKPSDRLVPESPVGADACTYRTVGLQPTTLQGGASHYAGAPLAALVSALNSAKRIVGEPSCPAPGPNTVTTTTTVRFTYTAAAPVVITTSQVCGIASNGAIRVQAPDLPGA